MKRLMAVAGLLVFSLIFSHASAKESCITCHEDEKAMKEYGFPQFAYRAEEIVDQTHMYASCSDCHKGVPTSQVKEKAHEGLLTVMVVDGKGKVHTREGLRKEGVTGWESLEPSGRDRATQLLPKIPSDGKFAADSSISLLMWQDKNPDTFAFNPVIAGETCGKCHDRITKSFLKSPMGGGKGAHTQSQYRSWTSAAGPQSCGIWTASLTQPGQEEFTGENAKYYSAHATMPLDPDTAYRVQRGCNRCHTGCLDCHFDPQKKGKDPAKGGHSFSVRPSSLSCYGGGRAYACHAGPMERRRGDGYIRGEFTQAAGEGLKELAGKADIHFQKKVACVDCHVPNAKTKDHADLRRDVACEMCHPDEVRSHTKGPHKKVDCAACHTSLVGGYAFNFWTAEGPNPLKRDQDYLTAPVKPLLLKNPKGIWIPAHMVPHTSGNVRAGEVKLSKRLLFRNRPDSGIERRYFSNDAYAVTGLVKDPDGKDRDVMVWLNVDRVAHSTGKARACEDCHSSREQRITVRFEGSSYRELRSGEYTIVADAKGLRVTGIKGADGKVPGDLLPFEDKWNLRGAFSLPGIKNRRLYDKLKSWYEADLFIH